MTIVEDMILLGVVIFLIAFYLTFLTWLDLHYDTHHTDFLRKHDTKNKHCDDQTDLGQKNRDNQMNEGNHNEIALEQKKQ